MKCLARISVIVLMVPAIAMLAACDGGRDDTRAVGESGQDAALPAPEGARGSITGMPDTPGPGTLPAMPGDLPPDTPVASDGSIGPLPEPPPLDVDIDTGIAGSGTMPGDPGMSEGAPAMDEPTAQDAVAMLRDYYAAIDAGRYPQAHVLWSGGGDASGQSTQQFANGFADTASVSIEVEAPGRVEPAAGSRYIDVPVAIKATRRDGSVHRYLGIYTLRRAVVDGASAEQRAWRILSADIREVEP